ncbi:hypothetical protein BI292_10635 [Pseudomonas sp. 43NM1]|nr:hypothetical protein BI292_10635 [Pseudomonas sp. 43NM1]
MCTMTHFAHRPTQHENSCGAMHTALLQADGLDLQAFTLPTFQVVPAGKAFFHIRETSTGRVRGFRTDHNQACALARSLAARA